jgi:hypothetical protein
VSAGGGPPPDDDLLDGCDLDFTEDPTPDGEADLFVLFAEALDPATDKTVEQAEAEWRELLG